MASIDARRGEGERLLTVNDVAALLQLRPSTIYSWAQEGSIPSLKIGRAIRFRTSDIDAWLDRSLRGEDA